MNSVNIMGLELRELKALLAGWGEPGFRGEQVYGWIHQRLIADPGMITNIPKKLRSQLKEKVVFRTTRIKERATAEDGTLKLLLELSDGLWVETVLMRQSHGDTVCLSSQVGCRWRCPFCASGEGGLVRDLEVHEMVEQLVWARKERGNPDNLVLMGMGEPLDNLDNVLKFIRIIREPEGMGFGIRRLTLSTAGIVPGIQRLAEERIPLTLSVSLHAPNDQLRRTLVGTSKVYPLDSLMEACRLFFSRTGRRISFEYILIEGVNDLSELARELGMLLKDMPCHVNLIPLNPVEGCSWQPTSPRQVQAFARILRERGHTSVTVRRPRGQSVSGACGQLAGRPAGGAREGKGR